MQYSVQELSETKIEIAINIEKEEWNLYVKKAYELKKHEFSIEGFRKGKVPMSVLVNRYGAEVFYEDAIDSAMNKTYTQILEENKYEVVSRPELDVTDVSEDGLKAVITVVLKPKFEVATYTGLDFDKPSVEATEEEVDKVVDGELQQRSRLIEKEGESANGDTVVIDFVGSVDGVKFEGGSAEGFSLELGSGTFVPGFEEQLVGVNAGDEKDVTVTFPKEYEPSLAEKEAVFAVTVKEVQAKELPVLDDEFVKDIDDEASTVEEYKAKVKKNLDVKKAEQADAMVDNMIMEAIVNATELSIPDCMVEEELDYQIQDLERTMSQQYGLNFADYLKYTGATVESIREERKAEAEKSIKYRLVMEAILVKENISVTIEEIDEAYNALPEERQKPEIKGMLANNIVLDKLFKFLKENNNIK